MMVHWGWLIAAFYAGAFGGIFVMGLCSAAGRPMPLQDKQLAMCEQIKEEETSC